jgi:hypothetical protein
MDQNNKAPSKQPPAFKMKVEATQSLIVEESGYMERVLVSTRTELE